MHEGYKRRRVEGKMQRRGSDHSDTSDSDSDSDSDLDTLKCLYCGQGYEAGTCQECYHKLRREMDELKAKVAFLSFLPPSDQPRGRSSGPADVVLVASDEGPGGGPVPAHKAVLASRSPVFQGMFESEMEESRSGTVKISNVTYDALRSFVNYLYTAEAELDEQRARELYVLGDKYQVEHLKTCCEKFMVSELSWDNSVRSYAFAHQYSANHLLDSARLLIIDNMYKLAGRDEYKELVEKDPKLVVKIYEAYVCKQAKKGAPKEP